MSGFSRIMRRCAANHSAEPSDRFFRLGSSSADSKLNFLNNNSGINLIEVKFLAHRDWLPWASVGILAALCGGLGFLQYRWIGEITGAERSRLYETLRSRLNALSRAVDEEISSACRALAPPVEEIDAAGAEAA